jgi:hypothetical protein
MQVAFQSKTTTFPSSVVKHQLRRLRPAGDIDQNAVQIQDSVTFDHPVHRAEAVLKGFLLAYDDGDHNFGTERVGVGNVQVDGSTVSYTVFALMHDVGYDGLDLEHPFHGDVDVTVIAELEAGRAKDTGIDFPSVTVDFPVAPAGVRVQHDSVQVKRRALWAEPMLKAFRQEYAFGDTVDEDYFLQRAGARLAEVRDDVVDVDAHFELEDIVVFQIGDPAQQDKQTKGEIEVVVLAGLAKAGA